MKRHLIGVAVTAGAPIFELAIPCEVFGRHRPGLPDLGYDLRICVPPGPAVHTSAGFVADAADGYDLLERADTVIVSALCEALEEPPADLVTAVKAAHRNGARIVSLCSGAFVLAAAGILDGRRATTHWFYADEMARRYPAVRLDPSVLYVDDGDVLTSSGTSAGIDLCLHIVSADHGAAAANALARRLVAPAHRSGGQAQYIDTPASYRAEAGMAPLLDWMRAHLHEPLTVTTLARQANVTERTLLRQFYATTGSTPIKWLTAQRVLHARQLLETGTLPVDQVAAASGLGGPANFRRHFAAAVGVSPSAYRRAFQHQPGETRGGRPAGRG
ncbi:MAG TPA: helix-turn-helix domain-containing protein [Streptosporangiaceae bacterium]|nr:helix-turn-helix domain-containing protein [Streptosporangiaceae bacterium]